MKGQGFRPVRIKEDVSNQIWDIKMKWPRGNLDVRHAGQLVCRLLEKDGLKPTDKIYAYGPVQGFIKLSWVMVAEAENGSGADVGLCQASAVRKSGSQTGAGIAPAQTSLSVQRNQVGNVAAPSATIWSAWNSPRPVGWHTGERSGCCADIHRAIAPAHPAR